MLPFKKTLLVLIVCSGMHVAYACGNEYYSTIELPVKDGRLDLLRVIQGGDYESPYWLPGFGDNIREGKYRLAKEIALLILSRPKNGSLSWPQLEKTLDKGVDHRLLSDFAWYEVRIGDRQKAVKLLEKLYEKYPSEYNIVANLGTAYEVVGNNEKALEFLRKAVAINPQSHHGSEWIHIKILEQKVNAAPDYKQIIELGADKNFPEWLTGKNYAKPMVPDSLLVQLAYQLHERISFIPPYDPIVAQLILDFGDVVAMKHSKEEASAFYDRAVDYDSSLLSVVKMRKETVASLPAPAVVQEIATPKKRNSLSWLYIGAGAVLAMVIVYLFTRKKNNVSV